MQPYTYIGPSAPVTEESLKHLDWNPEACWYDIANGIVEIEDPNELADPDKFVFLGCTISKQIFQLYGGFYTGPEYHRAPWQTMQFIDSASPIYLLSEDNEEIYCFSNPMDTPILLGKLDEKNILYEMCRTAFSKISDHRE